MLRTWTSILFGRSYGHRDQGVGIRFDAGRLEGYFVDLTAKTTFAGPTDAGGLPLVRAGGRLVSHPTVILQLGLGHWDRWLVSDRRDEVHLQRFLDTADWTARHLDARGGLSVFPQLGIATDSPYSAMTQGLAISALVRANEIAAGRTDWLAAARVAAELMTTPSAAGGTARETARGLVLEEGVVSPPNTVLNGWLFALFGLHDLTLASGMAASPWRGMLASSSTALVATMPQFDQGWWSRYDTAGHLASPFYHRLHVAQLEAFERVFPLEASGLAPVRARWERNLASRGSTIRAIGAKAMQQLRTPPPSIR
jgi:heparosan-N-sulfate-glucuronate 5-epimerase